MPTVKIYRMWWAARAHPTRVVALRFIIKYGVFHVGWALVAHRKKCIACGGLQEPTLRERSYLRLTIKYGVFHVGWALVAHRKKCIAFGGLQEPTLREWWSYLWFTIKYGVFHVGGHWLPTVKNVSYVVGCKHPPYGRRVTCGSS